MKKGRLFSLLGFLLFVVIPAYSATAPPDLKVISQWGGGLCRCVAVSGHIASVSCGSDLITIDVTDPHSPVEVGRVTLAAQPEKFTSVGHYIYAAVGDAGVQIVDITSPYHPEIIGSFDTPGHAYAVAVQGRYAYVADHTALLVLDVSDIAHPVEAGFVPCDWETLCSAFDVSVTGNCVAVTDLGWGAVALFDISLPSRPAIASWVDGECAVLSGKLLYTQVGYTSIITDVSSVQKPVTTFTGQLTGWYDFIPSVAASGHFIFYCGDTRAGVKVIDASDPANPQMRMSIPLPSSPRSPQMAVANGLVFTVDSRYGLRIIDTSAADKKVERHSIDLVDEPWMTKVRVSGKYAYAQVGWGGIYIVDITDQSNLRAVGQVNLDLQPGRDYAVRGNYLYMLHDDNQSFATVDVSDPTRPIITSDEHLAWNCAHGVSASRTIVFYDHYAYVSRSCGLDVYDLTNPAVPTRVRTLTDFAGGALAICGKYAYLGGYRVSSPSGKLAAFDLSDPANPARTSDVWVGSWIHDIAFCGDYAYASDENYADMVKIDLKIPSKPAYCGLCGGAPLAASMAAFGNLLCAASFTDGIRVYDVSGPYGACVMYATRGGAASIEMTGSTLCATTPTGIMVTDLSPLQGQEVYVGSLNLRMNQWSIAASGKLVYLATQDAFRVLDASRGENMAQLGSISLGGPAGSVIVSGRYCYIAMSSSGVDIVDVSNPMNPALVAVMPTSGPANVCVVGDRAYIADGARLPVENVADPSHPVQIGVLPVQTSIRALAAAGRFIYAVLDPAGADRPTLCVIDCWSLAVVCLTPLPSVSGGFQNISAGLCVRGGLLYASFDNCAMVVVSLSDPANPKIIGSAPLTSGRAGSRIEVSGRYAYLSDRIVDISDPTHPTVVRDSAYGGPPVISGNYLFTVSSDQGLRALGPLAPRSMRYTGRLFGPVGVTSLAARLDDTPSEPISVKFTGTTLWGASRSTSLVTTNTLGVAAVSAPWPAGVYETTVSDEIGTVVCSPVVVSVYNPARKGAYAGGAVYLGGRTRAATFGFALEDTAPTSGSLLFIDTENPSGSVRIAGTSMRKTRDLANGAVYEGYVTCGIGGGQYVNAYCEATIAFGPSGSLKLKVLKFRSSSDALYQASGPIESGGSLRIP